MAQSISELEHSQRGAQLPSPASPSDGNAAFPRWVQAIVILGALLMLMGALIAVFRPVMLVSPGEEINAAVRVYAGYLFSRNLALAVMLLLALILRARGTLYALILLTSFVQLLDTGMDIAEGRWPLVPGVAIFAVLFFVAAAKVSGQPFWNPAAWKLPR